MMTDIKNFTATFNKIAHNKSEDVVFNDFMDMVICTLSAGKYEEEYLSIVKRYSRDEVDIFCELMAEMIIVMDEDGAGLTDCLGEFFQLHITRGRNGQFFTPPHVCDMMVQVTMDKDMIGRTILDPCCGSGRMLLSTAKVSRNNHFFGADIDHRCVKMTAINLCLNALPGEVAHMNSLSGEHWGGYTIGRTSAYPHIPIIAELAAKEGIIYNSTLFKVAGKEKQEPSAAPQNNVITITQTKLEF